MSKWYRAAAGEAGVEISDAQARELIYGMPYPEWKEKFQREASEAIISAFESRPIERLSRWLVDELNQSELQHWLDLRCLLWPGDSEDHLNEIQQYFCGRNHT